MRPIDILFIKTDSWCQLPILLLMLVATAKTHSEKEALIVSTKQKQAGHQGRQADKAGRLAGWQGSRACLLCFGPASFVLFFLLAPLFC